MAGEKPLIRVEVWSDLACPWCWVGWNRLDQAMQDLQAQAQFDVHWRAFLLDPAFPAQGEEIGSYYRRRFGSQAHALRQRLHDAGKWDGAPFADWRWRPHTEGAHELMVLAGSYGQSHSAAGLLFRKCYEGGANLSDRKELLGVACQLGLPPGVAEDWLGSGEAREAVRREDEEAKRGRQIDSVPTFLIRCGASKEQQLVGAESVRAFEVEFRKVMHEAHGTPPSGTPPAGSGAAGKAAARAAAGAQPAQPPPAGESAAAEE